MTYKYTLIRNSFGNGYLIKRLQRPQEVVTDDTGRARIATDPSEFTEEERAQLWIADLPREDVPIVWTRVWLEQRIKAENHFGQVFDQRALDLIDQAKEAAKSAARCLAKLEGYKKQLAELKREKPVE